MLALVSLLPSAGVRAEGLPRWELGVGLAGGLFSDYRGSAQSSSYALPFPYLIYRGERLRVDREGMRGLLFDLPRWRVNISIDGAVPVESEGNLRAGMPDLPPVLEVGPSIEYLLAERGDGRWRLRLPLRSAVAVDWPELREEGWLINPNLSWSGSLGGDGVWRGGVSTGPLYADARYHDYYYGVADAYATPARPAWKGEAGYSGWRLNLAANRRMGDWWLGGFVRYDNLSGTAFADSPLVEQSWSLMGGIAIAWVFDRSEQRVDSGGGLDDY